MKINLLNKNKGFTLIETLVAITIFTSSLLVILGLTAQGLSASNVAKSQLVASYLAQEGIEYIRNIRDTYTLYSATSQAGWDAFNNKLITYSCNASNGCYFNADNIFSLPSPMPMTQITFNACGSSCTPMKYDSSNGQYDYNTGTVSSYTRKIKIVVVSANETKVFSTVSWTQGSGSYNVTFSESLFNWVE